MSVKNYVQVIPMTSFDAANLMALVFLPINVGGLPQACFMIKVTNTSNVAIFLSFDGVATQEYVPAVSNIQLMFQTNNQPNNHVALMKKGTRVFVRGAAGIGLIYLSGYYQAGV